MCTIIHFQLLRLFKGKMIQRNCKLHKRTKERVLCCISVNYTCIHWSYWEKTSEDKESPPYGLQNLGYILV